MSAVFIIAVWFGFVLINICIAEWNDRVRRIRIRIGNPKQIEHFWYGLGYCLLCYGVFYISGSWIEFVSILLLHISVFTVAYNLFSDNPAFNLSKTTKALTDRLLIKLGFKSYEFVAITAFCISAVLFILQLFVK
jgi:hypothetical protein